MTETHAALKHPPLPAPVLVASLPEALVVEVHGEDAASWLQGQLTQDIMPLARGEATSAYALMLTLTGTVLTDLWVHCDAGRWSLTLPRCQWPALQAHAERFIIMEDVALEARADRVLYACAGPQAAAWVSEITSDGVQARPTQRLDEAGFDLWVQDAAHSAFAASLSDTLARVGGQGPDDELWEWLRVRRSIPRFGVDFGTEERPQEASLKCRTLSFTKGCYQGQEAVAMLEHRGKLKRKLFGLRIDSQEPLPPGAVITGPEDAMLGQLRSSVVDRGQAGVVALASLKRDAFDPTVPLQVAGCAVLSRWDPERSQAQ
ncbi:MAG: YgfZ/GcvT domain-containing protein [Polyangiales bacterium]